MSAAESARDLLPRLRRWSGRSWTPDRAEAAAAAVQRLADLGADLEGRARRPVPRLDDTGLADQLAVMVDDLLRTGSPVAEEAVSTELTTLRTTLGL